MIANSLDFTKIINQKLQVVDYIPAVDQCPDGTIYGNYSIITPNKTKLVSPHFIKEFQGMRETETGFTRVLLRSLTKRKYKREAVAYYRMARPPMTILPAHVKDAVYVDIKSAYPSIYGLLGWDVEYMRGRFISAGEPLVYPFPMSWKAGRSYVVSGARMEQWSRIVYGGKLKVTKYYNQHANPALVTAVYDVLSLLGKFAVYSLRAKYWNVDGGIMTRNASEIFTQFCNSIGLEARIKAESEDAYILSSGYWRVGQLKTKNWEMARHSELRAGEYNQITIAECDWLYNQLRKIKEGVK